MYTECPTCQTMFRVTGAILRAGHGQVECGHCHSIFDAIERLVDDLPPGPPPEPAAALEPAVNGVDAQSDNGEGDMSEPTVQWANDLPTGEFQLQDGELVPIADRTAASAAEAAEPRYVIEEPGEPEEITLEGDRIEFRGADNTAAAAAAIEAAVAEAAEPILPPIPEATSPAVFHGRRAAGRLTPAADDLDSELAPEASASRRTAVWSILSLVLLLGLTLQVVHHYRQDLVRNPRLGPELLRIYAALKLPLAPNWDVSGYEIQQWGVAQDPAASGTLRLRASILNRAGFAQPYPLLKLSLEDRWGDQVGSREFEPAEYLSPGTPADRLLAPNQPVNADIAIVDPGEDAVGFHVDVCLKTFAGVDCASNMP